LAAVVASRVGNYSLRLPVIVLVVITPGIGLRAGDDTGDIRIFITCGVRGIRPALFGFGAALSLLLLALLAGPFAGPFVLRRP
jgi:hypothetical protein